VWFTRADEVVNVLVKALSAEAELVDPELTDAGASSGVSKVVRLVDANSNVVLMLFELA
jgi:hypothetical protein